jgi:hypothetical protein
MGINGVYNKEAGPPDVKGPISCGKVYPVDFRREGVNLPHALNKISDRLQSLAATMPEQKPKAANPKGYKIQIDIYLAGQKGNLQIKRMIHTGNGNKTGGESSPVLQKKEIAKDGCRTLQGSDSEVRAAQYPENG